MDYIDRLENITVLGAAGKMGSGILMLTAMEVLNHKLKPENQHRHFIIYAMDNSNKALDGLMEYVKTQAVKYAERNIVSLRKAYAHRIELIDNEQIILRYALDLVALIRPGTRIEPAFDSRIIFEAVSERPDLKVELMLTINRNSKLQPWFFTNTSAIPISWLDEEAGLDGRIMGAHFYNPPVIQKLMEVVRTDTTRPELSYFINEFIENIGKTAVPAYDVVGFIGNGYFMRDIMFAETLVAELQREYTFPQAVYLINQLSNDFLIRPMGIFQLMDYVGVDVVNFIMSVMNSYIEVEKIQSPLVENLIANGVKGGQNHDGSQKDGIFTYANGVITSVYDLPRKRYVPVDESYRTAAAKLGKLPSSWMPWKQVVQIQDKDAFLKQYFGELQNDGTPGADLSVRYLQRFREIGINLVKHRVAFKYDDVNAVLINGFHHVYGPVNEYF
jgi:3-hydroxyacyl-CoA dehydrogenase